MPLPEPRRCDACVFYVPRPDLQVDFPAGECHYNAPVPVLDIQVVEWPLVQAAAFCAQWKEAW